MLKALHTPLFVFLIFTVLVLTACGGNSEEEDKSSIDQLTEKTAQEAVQYIQAPIDKARTAQNLADQHSDLLKQAAENEE